MDEDGNTYDLALPYYNEIHITINTTPLFSNQFIAPKVTTDHAGYSWSFDSVPWSLNLSTGSNLVTYDGYFQNISSPNTSSSLQSFTIKYNTLGAGTVAMRVTSPGVKADGSDSTAYTVTINIFDNSPPPPKPTPSPTPATN